MIRCSRDGLTSVGNYLINYISLRAIHCLLDTIATIIGLDMTAEGPHTNPKPQKEPLNTGHPNNPKPIRPLKKFYNKSPLIKNGKYLWVL